MPSLNSLGEWCAGVGSGIAAWGTASGAGTTIFTPAGGTDWLSDDLVVAQHCPTTCVLKSFDVRTSVETTVAPRGANLLFGGGGVWAAWLGGYGLYSSTGLYRPNSALGQVGPDGAIAYKREYYSFGPWDVRETSGLTWLLTPGDADNLHLLGGYRAVWVEAGEPRTAGACPTPNPMTRPFYWLTMIPPPTPADPDGWWCLYQDDTGRLLLHPVTSSSGYEVAPAGSSTFRPDLVRLSSTAIRVVWSAGAGELPSDIVVATIDITTSRTVLGAAIPPVWTEPTDPPVPPPSAGSGTPPPSIPATPLVVPTPVPILSRVYPHVDGVTDWRAQQTIRLLWDRTFDAEARLQALIATQGDLVGATNAQDDALARVRQAAGEALAIAQGVGAGAGVFATIPSYARVVARVLRESFVSPIVPLAARLAAQAQLTRRAAWEIYQHDDARIRLFAKTSGIQVNGRAVDVLVQDYDGSFATCVTARDNHDGTATIAAVWIPYVGVGDVRKPGRQIVPTAAIAAEPGPMTPV